MDDLLSDGEVSALLSELDAGMTGSESSEPSSSGAPEAGVTLD